MGYIDPIGLFIWLVLAGIVSTTGSVYLACWVASFFVRQEKPRKSFMSGEYPDTARR